MAERRRPTTGGLRPVKPEPEVIDISDDEKPATPRSHSSPYSVRAGATPEQMRLASEGQHSPLPLGIGLPVASSIPHFATPTGPLNPRGTGYTPYQDTAPGRALDPRGYQYSSPSGLERDLLLLSNPQAVASASGLPPPAYGYQPGSNVSAAPSFPAPGRQLAPIPSGLQPLPARNISQAAVPTAQQLFPTPRNQPLLVPRGFQRPQISGINQAAAPAAQQIIHLPPGSTCCQCRQPRNSQSSILCGVCFNAGYCSKDHELADWRVHSIICSSFVNLPPRPGPLFKTALIFPHDQSPSFVYLRWDDFKREHPRPQLDDASAVKFATYLKGGNPLLLRDQGTWIEKMPGSGARSDGGELWFRKMNLEGQYIEAEPVNQFVKKECAGRTWKGSWVVFAHEDRERKEQVDVKAVHFKRILYQFMNGDFMTLKEVGLRI